MIEKYRKQEKYFEDQIISNLITKAEKNLGQHLNEINIMIDSPSIYSLDFCVQKNYEKKNVTNNDIDYLIFIIKSLNDTVGNSGGGAYTMGSGEGEVLTFWVFVAAYFISICDETCFNIVPWTFL